MITSLSQIWYSLNSSLSPAAAQAFDTESMTAKLGLNSSTHMRHLRPVGEHSRRDEPMLQ